ncbi:MAG TPA: hypothetical protein EYP17_10280, partial [Candidatus Latescibacteria bacterium]|nr:hypothetical protein [Candidatus Latescibacterota bacterium]
MSRTGRRSVRIDGQGQWGRGFGTGRKRLVQPTGDHYFVVWVRAEGVNPRSVFLTAYHWDARTKEPAGPRVYSRCLGPTEEWQPLAVLLPRLPRAVESNWAGVGLCSRSGTGSAWFDDFAVVRACHSPSMPAVKPELLPTIVEAVQEGTREVRLENRWLRLVVLPELGGRVVECTFKPVGTNFFHPPNGLEDWLWVDGRRKWPDISKVRFRHSVRKEGDEVVLVLTARVDWLEVRREIKLGRGPSFLLTTTCTNRGRKPHKLRIQAHPEMAPEPTTENVLAIVSRKGSRPLRLQATMWLKDLGRWSALYAQATGAFLAKYYPPGSPVEKVHVYWNGKDRFCNIEELSEQRELRPGQSLSLSVLYFLGWGMEPGVVGDGFAFGAREMFVTPGVLRLEGLLLPLRHEELEIECLAGSGSVGHIRFEATPHLLHRAVFEVNFPNVKSAPVLCLREARTGEELARIEADFPSLLWAQATASHKCEKWGNYRNLAYWYWMGRLFFFGGHSLKVLKEGHLIWPREGGRRFGLGFRWPKPLEPGYVYRFSIPFRVFPDFIAIDGNVVWEFLTGEMDKGGVAVFTYVPRRKGPGMIWCVRDVGRGNFGERDPVALPPNRLGPRAYAVKCYRCKFSLPVAVRYERWKEPSEFWRSPLLQPDLRPLYVSSAEMTVLPPPKPHYPTDEVLVGAYVSAMWSEPGLYQVLFPFGVNGMWMDEVGKLTLSKDALGELRKWVNSGAVRFFGSWSCPLPRLFLPVWKRILEVSIKRANYLTELFPQVKFLLLFPETQAVMGMKFEPPPSSRFERVRRGIKELRRWKEKVWSNLRHPERCLAVYNTDSALFPIAYYYHGGADLAMVKNIHRQNVQIVGANGRGMARAYGKPFGLRYDPWNGVYVFSASPQELFHILRLFYFYDADLIDHEGVPFVLKRGEKVVPSAAGLSLLKASSFISSHPRRGEPIIKIAIMRGFGDTWGSIECEATGGEWSRPRPGREEAMDFDLLNVFFPSFGVYWRTNMGRFCTGTPFGQVDMVPWDTPLDHLRTFDLLVLMGVNGMSREQYGRLRAYVEGGGTLVAALGHFLMEGQEPRRFVEADLAIFPGASPKVDKRYAPVEERMERSARLTMEAFRVSGKALALFQARPSPGAEVLARTADGRPLILRKRLGKGEVYLFLSRYLTSVGHKLAGAVLEQLARRCLLLELEPRSDWLEYVVHKKDETYVIALFNHGRLKFPGGCGKDHGSWKGEVLVNLEKLGLSGREMEVRKVVYQPDKPVPFSLKPLRFSVEGNTLRIK